MKRMTCARMRDLRRLPVRPLFFSALLVALTGCAGSVARPPSPATTTSRPKAGYDRRVDEIGSVGPTALAGRRIAIDPGHGGFFRGALGVKGLTEAEVNLGVSLHLRGLLEAHGASVFMTRTTTATS